MNRARFSVLQYLLIWSTVAIFSLPLVVLLSGSLKSAELLAQDPYSIWPAEWRWENYANALHSFPFFRYLFNTMVLCTGCVAGTTISCSLAAYGLSRIRWRGRGLVFALVLGTMLLPWHVTMIPRFVLITEVGLYNSLWSIILPSFLGEAFYVFLLRQFFLTIPEELLEAGTIDGLNHWGLFTQIVLPLSKPAILTVALFQFVATWNDFGGPLLFLSDPDKFPLAYGLERFVSSYSSQTHLLLAATVLFTLPIVILFFFTQRAFIQGISTTGIKE
jgi:multiple sugar transport system permease protein